MIIQKLCRVEEWGREKIEGGKREGERERGKKRETGDVWPIFQTKYNRHFWNVCSITRRNNATQTIQHLIICRNQVTSKFN